MKSIGKKTLEGIGLAIVALSASSAFAGTTVTPDSPLSMNPAQVRIAKAALLDSMKSAIEIQARGRACIQKANTGDAIKNCMNAQAQESMADQQRTTGLMAKMNEELAAAAKK